MRGEASLGATTHVLLTVELLLLSTLSWHWLILAHVHGLVLSGSHLAVVLLFVAGELIWVNHG